MNILAKLNNMVRRAYVTLTNDDSKQSSYAQASSMNKVANLETIYPYGLFAQAPINSLVLLFPVQGNEENWSGICYSWKDRFKNLKEGEVLIGNTITQTFIKFDKDGNVQIDSKSGTITIEAGEVIINSPLTVSGNNLTELGQGAEAKNIARLGDEVTVIIGGVPVIGTITSAGLNKSI